MYCEGRGREFLWPIGTEFRTEVAPKLNNRSYICTSEFLLRECYDNLIESQLTELASSVHLNQGVVLITSHLSVEQMAKVQRMTAIADRTPSNLPVEPNPFVVQLDNVFAVVVRMEVNEHFSPGPPVRQIVSYPTFGGAPIDAGDPRDGNIALSTERHADFIAASHIEFGHAPRRIAAPRRVLQYWGLPWTAHRTYL